jgi:hypothetical protein
MFDRVIQAPDNVEVHCGKVHKGEQAFLDLKGKKDHIQRQMKHSLIIYEPFLAKRVLNQVFQWSNMIGREQSLILIRDIHHC